MTKLIYIIITIFSLSSLNATDSVRIYVTGYFFNKEKYIIKINGVNFYKKVSKGLDAFSFYVHVSDSMKSGQELDVQIAIRRRWSLRYKYLEEEIYYLPEFKYCILLRTHKRKRKYPLELKYQNNIGDTPDLNKKYWDSTTIYPQYKLLKLID